MTIELALLGFAIGCLGTMIGAGGGFILVPILLWLHPEKSPEVVTALSLAVVFCNAASGSIAYLRQGKVDIRSALEFAIAASPGALLGAWSTRAFARDSFQLLFGCVLTAIAVYLIFRRPATEGHWGQPTCIREFADRSGHTYRYSFDRRLGLTISAGVGYLSSLLGIGGGIIHVPALVHVLSFPVHVATATSHLILAIMTLIATVFNVQQGALSESWSQLMYLAPGVVLGAPLGSRLAVHVKGTWILRALAAALALVGLRLIFSS